MHAKPVDCLPPVSNTRARLYSVITDGNDNDRCHINFPIGILLAFRDVLGASYGGTQRRVLV